VLEHASAPPSPCALCALSALAIHAAQGQPGRERRGWYPLGQLEEELDAVARTGNQVVEVLHVMGGEDSPRRVLCPWRAHRLASTLPAVARATAVCFLRCECLRGRGAGRPRDPSHSWGAKCSPGRDNLENRASVRLCGTCWEPLKTAGQPCDELLGRAVAAQMTVLYTAAAYRHQPPRPRPTRRRPTRRRQPRPLSGRVAQLESQEGHDIPNRQI